MTGTIVQLRMHASEYELLKVSCHKSSQCYGTGHHLSMSERCTSTEVVMSECTALLGRRSGFGGVFRQWLQLMCCTNLLAAGPSVSIINVHKFRI